MVETFAFEQIEFPRFTNSLILNNHLVNKAQLT